MEGYLGEFPVDISTTPFANYGPKEWALQHIQSYGGNDGDHHKDWVLDQVARILNGTKVVVVEARWSNGHKEYRYWTDETVNPVYDAWVAQVKSGEDGPDTYRYSTGIAP